MGYINLGTLDQLQVEIPTERQEDWAQRLKDNFVIKIVEHDHSGNGKGAPLGANSLADGAVDGLKIRLKNGQPLQGEGSTTGLVIDILQVNANNTLDILTDIDSATIETLTVDSIVGKELVILNTTTQSITMNGSVGGRIEYTATSTTGNQSGNIIYTNDGCVSVDYVGADLDFDVAVNTNNIDITVNDADTTFKIVKVVL